MRIWCLLLTHNPKLTGERMNEVNEASPASETSDVKRVVKCPCCYREWPDGCEQAICIDLHNECIVCRFADSNRGTSEELAEISRIREGI